MIRQNKADCEVLSENSFDDDIFNSPRLKKLKRGFSKELSLKDFDVRGDYQLACEAVQLLCNMYVGGYERTGLMRQSVRTVCDIARLQRPYRQTTVGDVLRTPVQLTMLDGSIDIGSVVGECAVILAAGGCEQDCRSLFDGDYADYNRIASTVAFAMDGTRPQQFTPNELLALTL